MAFDSVRLSAYWIIDLDDLMQFIEQDPRYSSHLPEMRAYRAEFGV